ncbi:MAG: hypothetical protein M3401_16545 [Actinomycetota bacterium]|nr:hypothetical protein [Actinomycetota bacterium]
MEPPDRNPKDSWREEASGLKSGVPAPRTKCDFLALAGATVTATIKRCSPSQTSGRRVIA